MGVAHQYFYAFDASQVFLVTFFYAQIASVVAGCIVIVAVDIVGGYFTNVSQYVGCRRVIVLPQDAFLDKESGKTV